ncbi:MAG: Asp23/Gls24 family envelope stress response protein [Roseiflexus sp.]|nr:Asp23/Gls24 family envelope stress response protein [Roseiflexus sp.]MCS7290898.1 Asp23/Gls24 family envelope stress response protein [Roseiflexus sp.]MDW8146274.1 Asp23/Gls24 family envelope stress response protein [Roseiflexaceae bacterium]MDW8232722.1 Asp23/Gls24 family envelope stress response protein [Roseiflexaceae bacterium]
MVSQPLGHVTVAAPVLLALVRAALRETPGVVRLASVPSVQGEPWACTGPGAAVAIGATGVRVACAIVAAQGMRLRQVAATAQAAVATVLRELAGVDVSVVDVSIVDVATREKTRDHG